jgi:hypothetical protein
MNIESFNEHFLPGLSLEKIEYSSFAGGDFGDLQRVELFRHDKTAVVEFWSSGWLSIYVFDFQKDDTVLNVLLEPFEADKKSAAFTTLKQMFS